MAGILFMLRSLEDFKSMFFKHFVFYGLSSLLIGSGLFSQGAYFDASVLKDPTGYKLRLER